MLSDATLPLQSDINLLRRGTHSYPLGENYSNNVQVRFHLSVLLTSFLSWQPFVFVELRQFSLLTGPSRSHFIIFSYSPLSTPPLRLRW